MPLSSIPNKPIENSKMHLTTSGIGYSPDPHTHLVGDENIFDVAIIEISVDLFMELWKRQRPLSFVSQSDTTNGKHFKFQSAVSFINKNREIWRPVVSSPLNRKMLWDRPSTEFDVSQGRHRIAALQRLNIPYMQVAVNEKESENFLKAIDANLLGKYTYHR